MTGISIMVLLGGVVGLISVGSRRKHVLSTLLSLEGVILWLFLGLVGTFHWTTGLGVFPMVFLTFSVCEGAMGLSILVMMVRTHGNDYYQGLSVM